MTFLFCCLSAQVIFSCKIYAILVVSSLIKSQSYIARIFLWMFAYTFYHYCQYQEACRQRTLVKSPILRIYILVFLLEERQVQYFLSIKQESPIYLVKRESIQFTDMRKKEDFDFNDVCDLLLLCDKVVLMVWFTNILVFLFKGLQCCSYSW